MLKYGSSSNDNRGGGIIWLQAMDGDVVNYGTIKTLGADDKCGCGDILIKLVRIILKLLKY